MMIECKVILIIFFIIAFIYIHLVTDNHRFKSNVSNTKMDKLKSQKDKQFGILMDYGNLGYLKSMEKAIEYMENTYPLSKHKHIDWNKIRKKVNIILGNDYKKNYISACFTLISLIPDGHVNFNTEGKYFKQILKEKNKYIQGSYGFSIRENNKGEIIITYVYPNSIAEKKGIKVGQIVEKYNNKSIEYYLSENRMNEIYKWGITMEPYPGIDFINPTTKESKREETLNYLTRDKLGKKGLWTIKNSSSSSENKVYNIITEKDNYECLYANKNAFNKNYNDGKSPIQLSFIDNNIAYLLITQETDYQIDNKMISWKKTLDNCFIEINKKAKGLIIDLRCNSGGSDNLGAYFTEQIIKDIDINYTKYNNKLLYEFQRYPNNYLNSAQAKEYGLNKFINKSSNQSIIDDSHKLLPEIRENVGPFFLKPKNTYTGPLVCIINNNCVSTGEGLAKACKNAHNSRVIGFTQTNGSYGMVGGEVWVGKLNEFRFAFTYPFGVCVNANNHIIIDTNYLGIGGIYPTNCIPKTNKNLIEFSKNSVNQFKSATQKNEYSSIKTHDIELEYAIKNIRELIELNHIKKI